MQLFTNLGGIWRIVCYFRQLFHQIQQICRIICSFRQLFNQFWVAFKEQFVILGNFFTNLGSILLFAIVGTTISALVVGGGVYLLGLADLVSLQLFLGKLIVVSDLQLMTSSNITRLKPRQAEPSLVLHWCRSISSVDNNLCLC